MGNINGVSHASHFIVFLTVTSAARNGNWRGREEDLGFIRIRNFWEEKQKRRWNYDDAKSKLMEQCDSEFRLAGKFFLSRNIPSREHLEFGLERLSRIIHHRIRIVRKSYFWIALTWIHLRNCFQSSRQHARASATCLGFVNPTHSSRKSMNQPKSNSVTHSAVQWNSSDLNIKWLWKGPFLAIADNHRRRGRVRLFNYRARRIVRASV